MDFLDYIRISAIPFIVSIAAVWMIYPYIVKIAKLKNIVDNPNARKLQKEPVPVLGGVAVFFGIFLSLPFANIIVDCSDHFVLLTAMLMMLYLGTIDDILNLKASTRLIAQIGTVLTIGYLGGDYIIDNILGLWGHDELPQWLALILTLFVIVGIINAINLIDGVDGLSSGYGIMASLLFSVAFFYTGNYPMVVLCAATIGALTLFFLHNVFGKKTKMFIGDGGTMVLGIIIATYVGGLICQAQNLDDGLFINDRASVIPFTLAVLAIPVFDTLRVMGTRILKGKSPFHPDKTHLHHMFIDMGFTHIATTVNILVLNISVVGIWAWMYFTGVSAETQTIVIMLINVAVTTGMYLLVRRYKHRTPKGYEDLTLFIRRWQLRRNKWFIMVQKIVDRV